MLVMAFGMAGAYFGAYFFVKFLVSESPRKINFLLVIFGFIFGLIASIGVLIGIKVLILNTIGNPNLYGVHGKIILESLTWGILVGIPFAGLGIRKGWVKAKYVPDFKGGKSSSKDKAESGGNQTQSSNRVLTFFLYIFALFLAVGVSFVILAFVSLITKDMPILLRIFVLMPIGTLIHFGVMVGILNRFKTLNKLNYILTFWLLGAFGVFVNFVWVWDRIREVHEVMPEDTKAGLNIYGLMLVACYVGFNLAFRRYYKKRSSNKSPNRQKEKEVFVMPEQENKSSSRWWFLYHFWAGICLKLYVDDVSGLLDFVLGEPSGSDHASASSYAVTAALIVGGSVLLGYFLSNSLTKVIDRNTMSRKGRVTLKSILPIIYLIAAIWLGGATASLLAESKSVQKSSAPIGQQSEVKPVMVFTTTQSAEGATESDLDQTVLKKLESWIVGITIQKSKMFYPKDYKPKVSAKSVYVTVGGRKLIVVKLNVDNMTRSVTVMGIKGTELLRVSCIRGSNHDIPVWSGECGNEVRKSLGVSVQP